MVDPPDNTIFWYSDYKDSYEEHERLDIRLWYDGIIISYTLYKALLVSIGDDWMHLSITAGKGVVKSLLYISGWKKSCI